MSDRDAKDYAIEFGEYLAKAAENFIATLNREPESGIEGDIVFDDVLCDHLNGLQSAICEFRKRAERAK